MSVLASMIVEASEKHTDYQAVLEIFKVVTDTDPVKTTATWRLRRNLRDYLGQLSNREVGMKYDILKSRGLI